MFVKRVYTTNEIQNCEMPHCIMNSKYRPSQMSRNKNIIRATHSVPAIRLCNGVCKNFACIDENNEKLFSPEIMRSIQRTARHAVQLQILQSDPYSNWCESVQKEVVTFL